MPNPIRRFFACLPFPAPANQAGPNPHPQEEGPSMQAGPSEQRTAPRSHLQTALLAQMSSPPTSEKEFFSQLDAWSKQPNQARDEKRKEAVKKIKQWIKSAQSGFHLADLQLTNLPVNLSASPHPIKHLYAYRNRLTSLPENLPASLTVLDAKENQLTSLPLELGHLTELRSLNLSKNQFDALPDNISQLRNLYLLKLSDNQLHALPDSISQLRNLTRLDLTLNRFTTVPDVLLDLPPHTEVFLDQNPIPPQEIRRVRAELQNRRAQGRPVPQLILPEIEGDDNLEDALRDAAEAGFNVHARGLTANIARRLDVLAKKFPEHFVGDARAQRAEMRKIQQRLLQAFSQYGSGHPQLGNAQSMANQMFSTGLGDREDYYNDFQKSAGHVLSYVFLSLEEQWKKTPSVHLQEAHINGIAQLIDRLASGKGQCDTRLVEEVFQMIGMPLSEYAQNHPEVITDAPIPLSREQVREITLPLAKKILQQLMQKPGAGEDEQQAFRTALLEEMSKHPIITRDQLDSYLNEEIFVDWETFKDLVKTE